MKDNYFIPFPKLEAKRLILRRMVQEDASMIFSLRSDKSYSKMTGVKQYQSMEEARELRLDNIKSTKVLEGSGFVLEGIHESIADNGEYEKRANYVLPKEKYNQMGCI